MVDKNDSKEKISVFQYGDALTDCSISAVYSGFLPFIIGLIAIPASLTYVDKIVRVIPEIRVGTAFVGSVAIGLYTCKTVKDRCEARLAEKYTYP